MLLYTSKQLSHAAFPVLFVIMAAVLLVSAPQQAFAAAPGSLQGHNEPSQEEIDAFIDRIKAEPVCPSKSEDQHAVTPSRAQGSYPMNTGQILITDDKFAGLIPTGHAAIVWDREAVIEALGDGVVWNANNWDRTHGNVWGLEVVGTSMMQDSFVAEWCSWQVGKPYNFNFFDTARRDAFYCSQLVWASYYDNFGIDISTPAWGVVIYPMEILGSPNVVKTYQK